MNRRARCLPHGYDRFRHSVPRRPIRWYCHVALVVVVMATIVHWTGAPVTGRAQAAPKPAKGAAVPAMPSNETLPAAAAQMRDALLAAVQSGNLADLKTALELNELRPDIADGPVEDPIVHWRQASTDGTGRDILDALGTILTMKPAAVPLGRDIENNAIFVWPYLAERDLAALEPAERADFARLATPDEIAAMTAAKRWTTWRLTIGADGTWHSFRREK